MPETDLVSKVSLLAQRMGGVCHTIKAQADATDAALNTYINTTVPGLLSSLKDEILGGASAAYDTLKEIEDFLKSNDDVVAAIQALKIVKYDSQTLSAAEQTQARTNIGAASDSDLSTLGGRVTTAEGDIDDLEAALGTVGSADFVAVFNAAYEPEESSSAAGD